MRISDWSSDVCSSDLCAALDRSLKNAQEAANHFHAERSKAYAQHANAMREYMIALFQEVRSVARLQMQLSAAIRGELNLTTDMTAYETRLQENFEQIGRAPRRERVCQSE